MKPVVPAVIPTSAEHVRTECGRLAFSAEFHLDVVDGTFVPSVSWPYTPAGHPDEVAAATATFTLEVDLMVAQPLVVAGEWEKAGADMLVFHIETVDAAALQQFATHSKVSVGLSLHGDTPLAALEPYLPMADYVQLMGIQTIGAQGLPFDEAVLDKIKTLKSSYPALTISIDGSVNKDTITRLSEAGADRFICGSAIVGQSDPQAAHAELCRLAAEFN
jgi:ribulose-phosphate 3-epimerase